jgi:hypothetical protein
MTVHLREKGLLLALAIEYGFVDWREAETWACQVICEQEQPPSALVELAGGIRLHPADAVRMLREIPGTADPQRVFRLLLGRMKAWLALHPDRWPTITKALENMTLNEKVDVPERYLAQCRYFDDDRLLSEQGVLACSVEDVRKELESFLEAESLFE